MKSSITAHFQFDNRDCIFQPQAQRLLIVSWIQNGLKIMMNSPQNSYHISAQEILL